LGKRREGSNSSKKLFPLVGKLPKFLNPWGWFEKVSKSLGKDEIIAAYRIESVSGFNELRGV